MAAAGSPRRRPGRRPSLAGLRAPPAFVVLVLGATVVAVLGAVVVAVAGAVVVAPLGAVVVAPGAVVVLITGRVVPRGATRRRDGLQHGG